MRQNCRDAIITLIKQIKSIELNSKCSEAMLIVDQITSSLLASILYYFTGLGVKNITKINLIKKPEPHCIGIYYLSPKSLPLISQDFKDQPIYHSINILLCEETGSEALKPIASNHKVMERLAFFGELKLNIKYLDNNIGIISPQAQIFKSLMRNELKLPPEFANLLFESIVAGFGQKFILKVYHQNSPHILEIVKSLKQKYEQHQQYLLSKPKDIPSQKEQRNIRLLIVDRKIDLISPIVRNFYYFTMLSDVYNIDYTSKKIPSRQGKDFDIAFDDSIFCEYKNLHISKAQNNIEPDFLKFKKENKAAQLSSTNTAQNMEIKHIIRDIPQYNKKVQSYNSHISIMYEMSQMSRDQNIPQAGEIEQMIVTGIIGQDELKDKKIYQKAMELSEKIKNPDNLVRIWLLILLCTDIPQSEKKGLIGKIKAVPKFHNLASVLDSKLPLLMPKPMRLKPQFKKDKMFLDMHQCLLSAIVSELTERGSSKLVGLTVIGQKEKQEQSKFERLEKRESKEWLVCMLGGLGINQICQLERLQQIYEGLKINLITDCVMNSWSYISALGDAFH